ncbi:MAG TPA: hypothetical protein VLA19_25315 [Herpetosiphonaceae bacterium]|nr:hypothetical protein [Herpetosiphonaceae bacterium]
MSSEKKPSWWLFYVLWSLMTGFLAWDYWVPRPDWLQRGAAILIVLVFYSLIAWWLRHNRIALKHEDERRRIKRGTSRSRTVPLTSVQARYLKTVERYKRLKEQSSHDPIA